LEKLYRGLTCQAKNFILKEHKLMTDLIDKNWRHEDVKDIILKMKKKKEENELMGLISNYLPNIENYRKEPKAILNRTYYEFSQIAFNTYRIQNVRNYMLLLTLDIVGIILNFMTFTGESQQRQ